MAIFDRVRRMLLTTIVNRVTVQIDLSGISNEVYDEAGAILNQSLATSSTKNREAIKEAYLHVLQASPAANASDIWHHVVYRQYCEVFNNHRPQDPKQSWVRASGDALELSIEELYAPVLAPHGIQISALISGKNRKAALAEMGLAGSVGSDKLDIALRVRWRDKWIVFGGVHVKASLAERVSDDVPCSRAMMKKGYFSPLWTLDVKSFPPPTGNLVNRGELGTPSSPSEKRKYITEHGDFDNCYSGNGRTTPSARPTSSGKRIYTLMLADQPDQFAEDVITAANSFLKAQD